MRGIEANRAERNGDLETARQVHTQIILILERTDIIGRDGLRAVGYHRLATIEHSKGNYDEAKNLYDQSLTIKRKLGNQSGIATTLGQLGRVAEEKGYVKLAEKHYQQALEIFEKLGEKPYIGLAKKDLERVREKKHQTKKPET